MTTRWNLSIPDDTDRLVRSYLARRGMKKGDLSRFVDEAVKREVFREAVRAAREHNRDADPAEIEAAVNQAVEDARAPRA